MLKTFGTWVFRQLKIGGAVEVFVEGGGIAPKETLLSRRDLDEKML
ncbi:MAG: hypothetical protein ACTS6G_06095 [Candidatus Hodgkinia cicadicola]